MDVKLQESLPVNRLYEGRQHFSIIGLTGMAGSGCSTLASYMSSRDYLSLVRKPSDIGIEEIPLDYEDNDYSYLNDKQNVSNKAVSGLVFKQKYSICYEFANKYYQGYSVLKYTHVLWLYVLLAAKQQYGNLTPEIIKNCLEKLLSDKFHPRKSEHKDLEYKSAIGYDANNRNATIHQILEHFTEWKKLCDAINLLERSYVDDLDNSKDKVVELHEFIKEGSEFNKFVTYLLKTMAEEDYYSLCFLHHRLAYQIRLSGNPFLDSKEVDDKSTQFIYNVVKLINILIKGFKHSDESDDCRIVIDSLRNSLEARYFKERYTAFYLICVNDSENRERRLFEIIKEKMPKAKVDETLLKEAFKSVKSIAKTELRSKDFAKGKFASPDVENVIADAEIHINNTLDQSFDKTDKKEKNNPYSNHLEFCTMAEQWMKYSSLILHPGLITPSSEERCMVVAYTAKFNSSCLSRQVGAVITNQYHSIRTIGWNDVPFGQMPCGLRELHNIDEKCDDCNHLFSSFETDPHGHYGNKSFMDKVDDSYPDIVANKEHVNIEEPAKRDKPEEIKGLPFSYCFKTLHNTFEGEKNQVYTRSLHAEENAILQMAKYGGEPLMNGIIYVTASPCELCAKKLYQIGVRKIVYIDPYPGISMDQIIRVGFKRPRLKLFQGAYGASYFKLYQPFMSYKDELGIRLIHKPDVQPGSELLKAILEEAKIEIQPSYTQDEIKKIVAEIFKSKNDVKEENNK